MNGTFKNAINSVVDFETASLSCLGKSWEKPKAKLESNTKEQKSEEKSFGHEKTFEKAKEGRCSCARLA
jgi:hypothetical protein